MRYTNVLLYIIGFLRQFWQCFGMAGKQRHSVRPWWELSTASDWAVRVLPIIFDRQSPYQYEKRKKIYTHIYIYIYSEFLLIILSRGSECFYFSTFQMKMPVDVFVGAFSLVKFPVIVYFFGWLEYWFYSSTLLMKMSGDIIVGAFSLVQFPIILCFFWLTSLCVFCQAISFVWWLRRKPNLTTLKSSKNIRSEYVFFRFFSKLLILSDAPAKTNFGYIIF